MLLPLQGEENSVKTEKKVIKPLPGGENEGLQYLFRRSKKSLKIKEGQVPCESKLPLFLIQK